MLYFEKLAAEALASDDVRKEFLNRMIAESGYVAGTTHDALYDYLYQMTPQEMVDKIIEGVRGLTLTSPNRICNPFPKIRTGRS